MSHTHFPPALISRAIVRGGARALHSRWLMRLPIWLYRARLGFVFGSRLLLLEHIGRRSGRRRYVVLEVIGHPAPDTYVVASGFGTRSEWFRNIQARPDVRISVASRSPAPATARVLDQAQADSALQAYVTRHQRAWAAWKPVFESTLGAAIDEHHTALPMVELRLRACTPPARRAT